ncbi:phosphoserine phosphatase SerB [Kangiella sediminilitoris]|uniref:Phosphoserine phosphatase n=1 Tax=Kangiella sediminilitoris TaxID=1144748 RepID=A0A1B3B908_9GAMM|nr:phosphoserine phosphatase SerB [Kangiella sediminilitoris]AOE49282.1 Phosphoserine phosphatase SerB [Kangiella sediminilitoris]
MKQRSHQYWLIFSVDPLSLKRLEAEQHQWESPEESGVHFKGVHSLEVCLDHYASCYECEVEIIDEVLARNTLISISKSLCCDFCVIGPGSGVERVALAVFDMDSTLIPMEVIDELAKEAGVANEVASITELAMQGELDFNQSFEQRLGLLKGMPEQAVDKVLQRIQFNSGVESFLNWLDSSGADIGIASGGFDVFAQELSERVAFNEVNSNRLHFRDGKLTGIAHRPIVNATVKAESLKQWRQSRGLRREETIAVGDGANDLLMLKEAGFGVAYKAKPLLQKEADCVLQFGEMDALSDILPIVVSYGNKKSPS